MKPTVQYLQVGGCVRDLLLGLPVQDRDWLVMGATPEWMIAQGFIPVGKDFPVFLHPQTHEEYALARTERKSGRGHGGFVFYSTPQVTVTEDLFRRDLTINAMAMTLADDGKTTIIDPFGGQRDLQAKILRHVSPAFVEDPLRVFRVARFAARFPDFSVADETLILMRAMQDELSTLSPERVWAEFHRGLAEQNPRRMIEVLDACGALQIWFPEIARLHQVPQEQAWHPEKDVFEHLLLVLESATRLSKDPLIRLGALCHDLGKGTTPASDLPRHPHHAERGEIIARQFAKRLKAPKKFGDFAALCARWHDALFALYEQPRQSALWMALWEGVDLWRRPQNWQRLLIVVQSDYSGRPGYADQTFAFLAQADLLAQKMTAPFSAADRPTDAQSRRALLTRRLDTAILSLWGD